MLSIAYMVFIADIFVTLFRDFVRQLNKCFVGSMASYTFASTILAVFYVRVSQ